MTKGQEAPAETQQDRVQLTKTKFVLVKKGLRLEASLGRASRVICDPSAKKMCSLKHFWKMPLTEPPPGFDLGCLSCPSLTQGTREPDLHLWSLLTESQLLGWKNPLRQSSLTTKLAAPPCSPLTRDPHPTATWFWNTSRDGNSPLPWAACTRA